MMLSKPHGEAHRTYRAGWLRAAVLGANDGLVSTASLIVGVAASDATHSSILVAGVAGLAAGALSMAAGEYVSVSSQADTEKADLEIEKRELADDHEGELLELATIYELRGLTPDLAMQVAVQLTDHDALGSHARDELGITEALRARPFQAAWTSAVAFALGAVFPIIAVLLTVGPNLIPSVVVSTLVFLAGLGGLAARTGGAPWVRGAVRVVFWGALAMALTAVVGALFGAVA